MSVSYVPYIECPGWVICPMKETRFCLWVELENFYHVFFSEQKIYTCEIPTVVFFHTLWYIYIYSVSNVSRFQGLCFLNLLVLFSIKSCLFGMSVNINGTLQILCITTIQVISRITNYKYPALADVMILLGLIWSFLGCGHVGDMFKQRRLQTSTNHGRYSYYTMQTMHILNISIDFTCRGHQTERVHPGVCDFSTWESVEKPSLTLFQCCRTKHKPQLWTEDAIYTSPTNIASFFFWNVCT